MLRNKAQEFLNDLEDLEVQMTEKEDEIEEHSIRQKKSKIDYPFLMLNSKTEDLPKYMLDYILTLVDNNIAKTKDNGKLEITVYLTIKNKVKSIGKTTNYILKEWLDIKVEKYIDYYIKYAEDMEAIRGKDILMLFPITDED